MVITLLCYEKGDHRNNPRPEMSNCANAVIKWKQKYLVNHPRDWLCKSGNNWNILKFHAL